MIEITPIDMTSWFTVDINVVVQFKLSWLYRKRGKLLISWRKWSNESRVSNQGAVRIAVGRFSAAIYWSNTNLYIRFYSAKLFVLFGHKMNIGYEEFSNCFQSMGDCLNSLYRMSYSNNKQLLTLQVTSLFNDHLLIIRIEIIFYYVVKNMTCYL